VLTAGDVLGAAELFGGGPRLATVVGSAAGFVGVVRYSTLLARRAAGDAAAAYLFAQVRAFAAALCPAVIHSSHGITARSEHSLTLS